MKKGNSTKKLIFHRESKRSLNFRAKLIIEVLLQMAKHSDTFGKLFIVTENSFAAIISLLLR